MLVECIQILFRPGVINSPEHAGLALGSCEPAGLANAGVFESAGRLKSKRGRLLCIRAAGQQQY